MHATHSPVPFLCLPPYSLNPAVAQKIRQIVAAANEECVSAHTAQVGMISTTFFGGKWHRHPDTPARARATGSSPAPLTSSPQYSGATSSSVPTSIELTPSLPGPFRGLVLVSGAESLLPAPLLAENKPSNGLKTLQGRVDVHMLPGEGGKGSGGRGMGRSHFYFYNFGHASLLSSYHHDANDEVGVSAPEAYEDKQKLESLEEDGTLRLLVLQQIAIVASTHLLLDLLRDFSFLSASPNIQASDNLYSEVRIYGRPYRYLIGVAHEAQLSIPWRN
ncbi:hypothetical protein B0H11DRAFT_1922245 [Mycena galericulata]|nr:hypothetical protein B0H11DRAFT_1922245 [Mycena galericulata]